VEGQEGGRKMERGREGEKVAKRCARGCTVRQMCDPLKRERRK